MVEIFTNCHRLRFENICFVGFEKKKKKKGKGEKKQGSSMERRDDV